MEEEQKALAGKIAITLCQPTRGWRSIRKEKKMDMTLTAVFEKSPYGYIGYVEELPGANTQGKTLEEAKKNLTEAIQLVLEANRQLAEDEIAGRETIKQTLGTISI